MRVLAVGGAEVVHAVASAVANLPMRVLSTTSRQEAEGWMMGCLVDVVVMDWVVATDPGWLGPLSCPLASLTSVGILGEAPVPPDPSVVERLGAWYCSRADKTLLHTLLRCKVMRAVPRGAFVLSGTLPEGGIRALLPLLEAEARSGRMTLRSGAGEEFTVWIRDGEPVMAFGTNGASEDPLRCAYAVNQGWFSFAETRVDAATFKLLESWSQRVAKRKEAGLTAGDVRQRLRAGLATARTIDELRGVVQSVLDLGIDKAAEDGDTTLMDSLADVSILLEKNRIDEALKVLRNLLR